MALINCPECNKEISDKAKTCPNCGFPIEEYFNSVNNYKRSSMNMELDIDIDEKDISTINGIQIDLANLIATNNFEKTASAKSLNRITHIGIVQCKTIIEDFLSKYPEYDKESEFNSFLEEQSTLLQNFKTSEKLGRLLIDYQHKTFKLGFWGIVYKFSDIEDIIIHSDEKKVYVEILTNSEHIPNIKINIRNIRTITPSITDIISKNLLVTKEEALEKASEIKTKVLELKNMV